MDWVATGRVGALRLKPAAALDGRQLCQAGRSSSTLSLNRSTSSASPLSTLTARTHLCPRGRRTAIFPARFSVLRASHATARTVDDSHVFRANRKPPIGAVQLTWRPQQAKCRRVPSKLSCNFRKQYERSVSEIVRVSCSELTVHVKQIAARG